MEIPTRPGLVNLSFCDEWTRLELPKVTAFPPELGLATLFSFDGLKGSRLAKAILFWPLTRVSFSEEHSVSAMVSLPRLANAFSSATERAWATTSFRVRQLSFFDAESVLESKKSF